MASRVIRSGSAIISIDDSRNEIRIRDSNLVLNAVAVALSLVAVWPFAVVHVRPEYSVTLSGYVMSGCLAFAVVICAWLGLTKGSNDISLHLTENTVSLRSRVLGRLRTVPLSEIRFVVRDAPVVIMGNRTEGIAMFVEGASASDRVLHFVPEHAETVRALSDVLNRATERPAEETVRRVSAHAESLPKSELVALFGLLLLVVLAAFWGAARYLLAE